MRTGSYTLQQSLTPEAATIVKQAVSLARRRGHAQVTPLHVASAMLASSTGLLKRACLKTHSHPLQCNALELCFNVALNRLPTSASSPLLTPHPPLPSLSNALVAAFKRAQAHQRRGSIENQQQSILALKVEIEQLVISVLDDPSVSRVMREAGFSSLQVKNNVEQELSLEISSSKSPVISGQSKDINTKSLLLGNSLSQIIPTNSGHEFRLSFNKTVNQVQNDDVNSVLEAMINNKTKNTVIVAECPSTAESLVKGLINKFDKKNVPVEMSFVQFISVPLFTLRNISREEFEVKLGELRSLVKSHLSRGVVLYLGDLYWVSEFWSKYAERSNGGFCPVEYMIMELSRLVCGAEENKRLWLMGTATFKTYAKCKIGRPSLETLWSLHSLTIPVGNLALSLSLDHSQIQGHLKKESEENDFNWLLQKAGIKKELSCCPDCLLNFKREVQAFMNSKKEFTTSTSDSSLPLWLQKYKDENNAKQTNVEQECDKTKDLCKKWNSICSSVHKKPHFLEKVENLASPFLSPSTSISSNGQDKAKIHRSLLNWPVIFEPSRKEHQIFLCENGEEVSKPDFPATKPELLSNPNSSPNSASSSEASGDMGFPHQFKKLSPNNMKILCNALEKKVPWQKEIIPDIVTTILKCRSGMMTSTKSKAKLGQDREESWLFFFGVDQDGKEIIARELSKTVFGSHDNFVAIGLSSFRSTTTRADSSEEVSNNNKRARNEHGGSPFMRFLDAVRDNPSRVFLIEDFDQMDYHGLKGFKRAIEDGSFTHPDGDIVLMKDAIVVFSCESFSSTSRACSPFSTEKELEQEEKVKEESSNEETDCGLLDLNIATEDGNEVGNTVLENEILDSVDKLVFFKIQVL